MVSLFMQDGESRPEQTSRVTAVNSSSNWHRTAIAIVITATVTGASGYLLGIRTNQNTSQNTQRVFFQPSPTLNTTKDQSTLIKATPEPGKASANPSHQVPTSVTTQISIPQPKTGFQQRINGTFKYGYNYPISSSLNTLTLRTEELWSSNGFFLLQPDPKASLLDKDLYCNADGPTGNTRCQNTKVDDFTNSLGFKGFKVYRTKTTSGAGAGTYQDVAYVFPLQKKIKDEGLIYYEGVLFYVEIPTQSNLSALEEIANSFFNF